MCGSADIVSGLQLGLSLGLGLGLVTGLEPRGRVKLNDCYPLQHPQICSSAFYLFSQQLVIPWLDELGFPDV